MASWMLICFKTNAVGLQRSFKTASASPASCAGQVMAIIPFHLHHPPRQAGILYLLDRMAHSGWLSGDLSKSICADSKCLLSNYHVPGTLPSARKGAGNQTGEHPCSSVGIQSAHCPSGSMGSTYVGSTNRGWKILEKVTWLLACIQLGLWR